MRYIRNEIQGVLPHTRLCRRRLTHALQDSKPVTDLHTSHSRLPAISSAKSHQQQKKQFSTSKACAQNSVASESASWNPRLDFNSLVKPDTSSFLDSPIRKKLRAWSRETERTNNENAPEKITIGRKIALPNSLFLNPDDQEEKELYAQDDTLGVLDESTEGLEPETYLLRPGDLFQIKGPKIRLQWAIHLGAVGSQSQYFLQSGQWLLIEKRSFKSYVIRNFATLDEVEAIRAFLPAKAVEAAKTEGGQVSAVQITGFVPSRVAQPALDRFAQVSKEAETFKRENLRILENVYETFADDTYFRTLSLDELVQEAFQTDLELLSSGARLVIFSTLVDHDFRIQLIQSRDLTTVLMLPKRLSQSMQNTTNWARMYQDAAARAANGKDVSTEIESNPLTSFISKARRLIVKSRKIRSPTTIGNLGPANSSNPSLDQRPTGEIFDDNDRQIIEFIWNVCVRHPANSTLSNEPYRAVRALILRAVGAYPKLNLGDTTGKLFLQELGCLDPWSDPTNHHASAALPFTKLSKEGLQAKDREQRTFSELAWSPLSSLSPSQLSSSSWHLPFPDTAAPFRKDWGSLEVFCVDSVRTRLVDDGISVQPVTGRLGYHWFHVHIAHPSAFVPYGHPFERRASLMGSSFYGSTVMEPPMPVDLLEQMGIAANRAALTISTLLSPDGNVEDIQISPSIVRNVIRLTSEALEEFNGPKGPDTVTMTVGTVPFANDPDRKAKHIAALQLVQKHSRTLKLMEKVLRSRWQARQREIPEHLKMDLISKYFVDVIVSHKENDLGYDRMFQSLHSYGDPTIQVICPAKPTASVANDSDIKDNIVDSAMVLAGESTAAWLRKRRIPAIYLGHHLATTFPISKLNSLARHEGYINPMTYDSVTPIPHVIYNVMQYLPVTSPLRRYRDLYLHYQIDSYLKAEASGLISPGSSIEDESVLMFSTKDISRTLPSISNSSLMANIAKQSKSHWITHALFRAFHFNQAKLPEIWDVEIDNPVRLSLRERPDVVTRGRLVPFGTSALIKESKQGFENQAKFRQFLPVTIETVDPDTFSVICRAVGPATDEPLSRVEFG